MKNSLNDHLVTINTLLESLKETCNDFEKEELLSQNPLVITFLKNNKKLLPFFNTLTSKCRIVLFSVLSLNQEHLLSYDTKQPDFFEKIRLLIQQLISFEDF